MSTWTDPLPEAIEASGAVMPPGYDGLGIKSVSPTLTSSDGFKWPLPGGVVYDDHDCVWVNKTARPLHPGDGLCITFTWGAMASGGFPARTLLIVAYKTSHTLGADDEFSKIRVAGPVAVVGILDGEDFLRNRAAGANFEGGHFSGFQLNSANFKGTCFSEANLQRASFERSDLRGADLRFADLRGVDFREADLRGADLRTHLMPHAQLLHGAQLQGARALPHLAPHDLPAGWVVQPDGFIADAPLD